mmetsp:Transcript_14132/g.36585  ORF Transcript_14132/g.36585 Transcript_14132/m.36585 type:complete len:84 (-) Transcript_14132:1709-1960(-)
MVRYLLLLRRCWPATLYRPQPPGPHDAWLAKVCTFAFRGLRFVLPPPPLATVLLPSERPADFALFVPGGGPRLAITESGFTSS